MRASILLLLAGVADAACDCKKPTDITTMPMAGIKMNFSCKDWENQTLRLGGGWGCNASAPFDPNHWCHEHWCYFDGCECKDSFSIETLMWSGAKGLFFSYDVCCSKYTTNSTCAATGSVCTFADGTCKHKAVEMDSIENRCNSKSKIKDDCDKWNSCKWDAASSKCKAATAEARAAALKCGVEPVDPQMGECGADEMDLCEKPSTAAPTDAPTHAPTDAPTHAPTQGKTKAPAAKVTFGGTMEFKVGSGNVSKAQVETATKATLVKKLGVDESAVTTTATESRRLAEETLRRLAGTWSVAWKVVADNSTKAAVAEKVNTLKSGTADFEKEFATQLVAAGADKAAADSVKVSSFTGGEEGASTTKAATSVSSGSFSISTQYSVLLALLMVGVMSPQSKQLDLLATLRGLIDREA